MNLESIRTIAVVGAGQMGAGIAEVAASHGLIAMLCDVQPERAEAAKRAILSRLDALVAKGKVSQQLLARTDEGLMPSTFEGAVRESDLVIEAATENIELKRALFRDMDSAARSDAILATNTSSISVTLLAAETRRPERVVGMHFMNPVPRMKLVELVVGTQTGEQTVRLVRQLAEQLQKTVIVSQDSPGFLVNRVLLPLINEACFALQERVGTTEDIDQAARLGLNHPMGPLELADLIGLDTVLAIAEVLQRELGDDKYRPATNLRNLVRAGWLGKKSRRGFYEYDEKGQKLSATRIGAAT